MKKGILTALLFLASLTSFAQDFEKGGSYISVGYGLDPWGYPAVSGYGSVSRTAIGPIFLGYEYGVTDILGIGRIGAGITVGQSFYTQKYLNTTGNNGIFEDVYRASRTSIILRAAYHFEFDVPGLDVYAGVGAAVNIYSYNETYYDAVFDPNPPYYVNYVERNNKYVRVGNRNYHQVFAGVRYFFTPAFGVYAQAGHGAYALNGGMVFHF